MSEHTDAERMDWLLGADNDRKQRALIFAYYGSEDREDDIDLWSRETIDRQMDQEAAERGEELDRARRLRTARFADIAIASVQIPVTVDASPDVHKPRK